MAKSQSLASMSVDALLKIRDDIGAVLSKRMGELQRQLASLTGTDVGNGPKHGRKPGSLKGRKVAPKYKGPGGELWAGRGATPRWMAEAIKGGGEKDDFLINGAASPAKSASKKRAKKK